MANPATATAVSTVGRRALHYVFKIGNRSESINYFTDYLGMQVLRHEEFDEGCKATCNGPYDGKWSKTMIGFGPEDSNFVLELTYNYGISTYLHGNDLTHLSLVLSSKLGKVINDSHFKNGEAFSSKSPCGYPFMLKNGGSEIKSLFDHVVISCSNFQHSVKFWKDLLGMKEFPLPSLFSSTDGVSRIALGYAPEQTKVVLQASKHAINRGSAFGRIAFACPSNQLQLIEKVIVDHGEKVLTPYISLDTPGKATVQVVILADPDGHEICFVGDEGFKELSKVDPNGLNLLKKAMSDDKSDEWFKIHGKEKASA